MTEIAYGSERKGPSSEQQKVILEKAKERIPEPVYTLLLDYIVKTLEANYMHLDGCTSTEVAICAILLYLTEGKSQRVFRKFSPPFQELRIPQFSLSKHNRRKHVWIPQKHFSTQHKKVCENAGVLEQAIHRMG